MAVRWLILVFNVFLSVNCGYPPIGDEVQAGSVLLPASRRGRYLANIVRRQAVDGTGIKFNKDADRMNAEAKKKVDVLSEELLPYIIAEQERRTTLYKRVMTAIQNGEKGVTIAEMRNKPPLIIRKGLMFRCPMNRAPREPDGSGIIMCEEDIEPSPVMFDSCLSAEDKDLYVADNKYFFCNRHKVEGPDLPRNGTTVIGCAPMERTSLNYTSSKCALEDTDDVVVHYRYYPDRTYKFVTELDPDREVCDHWNPCQIGYIYSLPAPDQALPANELWRDYEFVPQDSINEFVHPSQSGKVYKTAPRRVKIPNGLKFDSVWKVKDPFTSRAKRYQKLNDAVVNAEVSGDGKYVTITLTPKWSPTKYGPHFAVFTRRGNGKPPEKSVNFVNLEKASVYMSEKKTVNVMGGQRVDTIKMTYRCTRCELQRIMVRASDHNVYNLDSSRYRVTDASDPRQKVIQINLDYIKPKDVGYLFAVFKNEDNAEEYIPLVNVNAPEIVLKVTRLKSSTQVGEHYDQTIKYECGECELTDVLCNGESVTASGRVSIVKATKLVSISFPSYEDSNSCVYLGIFTKDGKSYKKILGVLDNASPSVTVSEHPVINSPSDGEHFETSIGYSCDDCNVEKVTVNGIQLEPAPTRRTGTGPMAYFMATQSFINIQVTEFTADYEGVYQALFTSKGETITKTIMEIRNPGEKVEEGAGDGGSTASDGQAAGDASEKRSTPVYLAGGKPSTGGADESTAAGSEAPGEGATDGNMVITAAVVDDAAETPAPAPAETEAPAESPPPEA